MGYKEALEAAGAKVLAFKEFGTWQGDWWALVEYQGKRGWIHDYFGSCSGCDAFEAEFGWDEPTPQELAEFGKRYLDDIKTQEEAEQEVSKDIEWDLDAEEVLKFIKENGGMKHD
jgi:hypothetical protein